MSYNRNKKRYASIQNMPTNKHGQETYKPKEQIFKYINPNSNDMLSELSGYDLQDCLILIEDYYLELRNILGLDKNITFGLELEFENAQISKIVSYLNAFSHWTIKSDSTLTNGAEITSPILHDNLKTWKELEKICNIVKQYVQIGKHSGGHIHIGTQTLGDEKQSWLNFIRLWSVYENVIYRFTYNEYLSSRSSLEKYACPIGKCLSEDYEELMFRSGSANIKDIVNLIAHRRNQAINFFNTAYYNSNTGKNTIEFRCPNGTFESVIWQNNVNLFVKLLEYSKNIKFDNDLIRKRYIENVNKYDDLKLYNEIYLEQALELCDMIFTNNLDKIYFLRQYLKSFQVGDKELEKSKPFVKKVK